MKDALLYALAASTVGILIPSGILLWIMVIDELKGRRK